MRHHIANPVGVLVLRASVEDHGAPTLVVHLVEVHLPAPDRKVGVVSSSEAALALVREWLDALLEQGAADGGDRGSSVTDP